MEIEKVICNKFEECRGTNIHCKLHVQNEDCSRCIKVNKKILTKLVIKELR